MAGGLNTGDDGPAPAGGITGDAPTGAQPPTGGFEEENEGFEEDDGRFEVDDGAPIVHEIDATAWRERRRSVRRAVAIAAVLAVALIAIVALQSDAQTPDEHAADRAAPSAETVTAHPRVQELRDVRVGDCEASQEGIDILASGATSPSGGADPAAGGAPGGEGAAAAGAVGPAAAVFTAVHVTTGMQVGAGTHLAEISGRPLLALPLPFPLYRDIRPGDTGADVEAVQDVLTSVGRLGDHDHGTFDRATRGAIDGLYDDAGVEPAETGPEVDAAIDTAESQVDALQARVDAGDTTAAVELGDARDELDAATARRGTVLPRAEVAAVPAGLTVATVSAQVGDSADAGQVVARLAGAGVSVTCSFPLGASVDLREGQAAVVSGPDGAAHPGTIGAPTSGEDGVQAPFQPTDPLPAALAGGASSVDVTILASAGPVLSVPALAVNSLPDGTAEVLLVEGDEQRAVAIVPGITAGGWVEVTDPPFDESATVVVGGDGPGA